MQKDRGFRALAIFAICIAVAALSIGYAALSQTLNVNGTTTIKGNNWDVHFENLTKPTAVNKNLVGSASETSSSLNTTTLTFAANLVLPGDSITYTWDVKNAGTIDAKLSSAPVLTGLSEAQAKNVTYTFTYADGTAIAANDTLTAGQTKSLKLVVTYNASATSVETTDTSLSLSTTLTYVQK
jgi:hypothetical protein